MTIIYFEGKEFNINELKKNPNFSELNILSAFGEKSKFGFKEPRIAEFSLGKLSFANNDRDNVDKLLYEIKSFLKMNKGAIYTSKVTSIRLLIELNVQKEINFVITKDLLTFHRYIDLDIKFEIIQEANEFKKRKRTVPSNQIKSAHKTNQLTKRKTVTVAEIQQLQKRKASKTKQQIQRIKDKQQYKRNEGRIILSAGVSKKIQPAKDSAIKTKH